MKKAVIAAIVLLLGGGAAYYGWRSIGGSSDSSAGNPGANASGGSRGNQGGGFGGGGFGGGGFGNRGGGGGGRGPMTVELAKASMASLDAEIMVVGNLIGETTVAVAPRTAGRLEEIYVRLGDRVNRGQRIAKIEDYEIVEQVKQAEAAQEVSLATIRQREADLKLAETNVERSRSLYEKKLLPKQTLDDNEARYLASIAQVDLARAQTTQSKARLDELRINLANTVITSPVTGFVARRAVDPGAFVSQSVPVADVVDITLVRLVANVVEKDLKQLESGNSANVQVDAFPGETFAGRIARVSPVLDPATRTAPIEIEIPNPTFRLKPGMYARVGITTQTRKNALVLPANSVVDLGGRRGVFQLQNNVAVFRTVQVGTEKGDIVEILAGLKEGEEVISTGAGALRDGDRVLLAGSGEDDGSRGRGPQTGSSPRAGSSGQAPSGATGGRAGDGGRSGGRRSRQGGQGTDGSGSGSAPGGRTGGDVGGQRGGSLPAPSSAISQ
jgi:HlyD family secretion protein